MLEFFPAVWRPPRAAKTSEGNQSTGAKFASVFMAASLSWARLGKLCQGCPLLACKAK